MLKPFKLTFSALTIILSGCVSIQPPKNLAQEVLPQLSEYYGIELTTNTKNIPPTSWGLQYTPITVGDEQKLSSYLSLFEQEFSKMPPELLTLSNLKSVVFVKDMSVVEQPRAAVPDYLNEVLYYDINVKSAAYARRVIHHEFYHMLEQELFGSAYYIDPDWTILNNSTFSYGNGGAFSRKGSLSGYDHPITGFINGYAMSGIEEDKAEIWTILWLDYNWQKVYPMLKADCVLISKINQLINQMAERTEALPVSFWHARFNPYLLKNKCS